MVISIVHSFYISLRTLKNYNHWKRKHTLHLNKHSKDKVTYQRGDSSVLGVVICVRIDAFKLSQHQDLFKSVISSHPGVQSIGVWASASVLPMNIQDCFLLGLTGLTSLRSKGLSRVFSSTIVQKHQFFSTQPSLWSNSHIHTWLLEKP